MAEALLAEFSHQVADCTIIPGSGGEFEVLADGELIYSKKATGRHATIEEVKQSVAKRLAKGGH